MKRFLTRKQINPSYFRYKSPDQDVRLVKKLFSYLGKKDMVLLTASDWEKPDWVTSSASKPRLLKVRLVNSNQRTTILKKAKLLPSNTFGEQKLINSLYSTLQSKQCKRKLELTIFIDRIRDLSTFG